MARFFRTAILMACFLSAGSAFAAGGSCGSIPVPSGVTSCFYISAAGADTNNGTSEATPWLHSPGMANYAGGHTLAPGDGIIFRGGDTWHFGNSALSPYAGVKTNCDFNATQSAGLCLQGKTGTANNPIYYGFDFTWFSGGSWARPLFNADNPLTPNPSVVGDSVASCAFQLGAQNKFVSLESAHFVTFDNFELTGLCSQILGGTGGDFYFEEKGGSNLTLSRLYIHGWTHIPFSCGGSPGYCFNLRAFDNSTNSVADFDFHNQIVVDGSDSDPAGLETLHGNAYNFSQNVFRYTAQIVFTGGHTWHDNLFSHWFEPGDGAAHGNLFEDAGTSISGSNAFYNNVFQHICSDSGACPLGIVGIWPEMSVGTTEYWFNNLMYDVDGSVTGNYFNIGQNANFGNQGTLIIFNNTFQVNGGTGVILQCNSTFSHPFTAANNHYITNGASQYSSPCTGGTFVTDSTRMSNATATAAGYTQVETFAYSPPAANSATVGVGTNEQSRCTALSAAGLAAAATACQSDTTFGVSYNAANHTAVYPARTAILRPVSATWDVGAYQSGGTQASAPNPPTGLTASVQ
jgi:hypothetical protein